MAEEENTALGDEWFPGSNSTPAASAAVESAPETDRDNRLSAVARAATVVDGLGLLAGGLDRAFPGRNRAEEVAEEAERRGNEVTRRANELERETNNHNTHLPDQNRTVISAAMRDPARVSAIENWMSGLSDRVSAIQHVPLTADRSAIDVARLPDALKARAATPEFQALDLGSQLLEMADSMSPRSAITGLPSDVYSPVYNRLNELALRHANSTAFKSFRDANINRVLNDLMDTSTPGGWGLSRENALRHPGYVSEVNRFNTLNSVGEALDRAFDRPTLSASPEMVLTQWGTPAFADSLYTVDPSGHRTLTRVPDDFYRLSRDFHELFPQGVELRPNEMVRQLRHFDRTGLDNVAANWAEIARMAREEGHIPATVRPLSRGRRALHTAGQVGDFITGMGKPVFRTPGVWYPRLATWSKNLGRGGLHGLGVGGLVDWIWGNQSSAYGDPVSPYIPTAADYDSMSTHD